MNKKLKYLSIIPLYGTCILFVYLFILSLKDKISKKNFLKSFILCAIVSAICWYMVMMIVYIVSEKIIHFDSSIFLTQDKIPAFGGIMPSCHFQLLGIFFAISNQN